MLARVVVNQSYDDRETTLARFCDRVCARANELEEEQARATLEEPIAELLRKGVDPTVIVRSAEALASAS